ncbi:MAG: twitching motility protein PilT [Acidimicrobiales bacterium]
MSLVLDSGALIALERNERSMWVRLKATQLAGELPVTHAGVVGQVWRGGPGQAQLARALGAVDVRPVDETLGRAAGELLGTSELADVIDAAVVLLSMDGDEIITADRVDFERLVVASGRHVELLHP